MNSLFAPNMRCLSQLCVGLEPNPVDSRFRGNDMLRVAFGEWIAGAAVGASRKQTQNSGNELEDLLTANDLSKNWPQNELPFCVEYALFMPITRWLGTESGGFPLSRE
jgi:hypothetical protein